MLTLAPIGPVPVEKMRLGTGAFAHVPGAQSEPVAPRPRAEPIAPLTPLALAMMAASGAIVKARLP